MFRFMLPNCLQNIIFINSPDFEHTIFEIPSTKSVIPGLTDFFPSENNKKINDKFLLGRKIPDIIFHGYLIIFPKDDCSFSVVEYCQVNTYILQRQRGTNLPPNEPKTTFAVTKKVHKFYQFLLEKQASILKEAK